MHWLDPILKPLARLAIRKGWRFQDVERRLRKAYVDAAVDLSDEEVTDSKISIMTGLQRRDIASFRKFPEAPIKKRQPLAEIIAVWWNDPEYPIQQLPIHGAGRNFTTLARSVRQDVHPRTFLDLLVECDAVTETPKHVSLNTRHYQPSTGSDDQLSYLAENVGDHLSAAVGNVVDAENNYEMGVHYVGLSEDAISDLDALFRIRMKPVLEELDTVAREFPKCEQEYNRFRAGGYFFNDREKKDGSNNA